VSLLCHCVWLLCHCCVVAVSLLCHCCVVAGSLLCRCCVIAVSLLCHCVWLLCHCCVVAVSLLCHCCVVAGSLLCHCCVIAVSLQSRVLWGMRGLWRNDVMYHVPCLKRWVCGVTAEPCFMTNEQGCTLTRTMYKTYTSGSLVGNWIKNTVIYSV